MITNVLFNLALSNQNNMKNKEYLGDMLITRLDKRYTKPENMKVLVVINTESFDSTTNEYIISQVKKSKYNTLASEKGIIVIDRYKLSREITADDCNK